MELDSIPAYEGLHESENSNSVVDEDASDSKDDSLSAFDDGAASSHGSKNSRSISESGRSLDEGYQESQVVQKVSSLHEDDEDYVDESENKPRKGRTREYRTAKLKHQYPLPRGRRPPDSPVRIAQALHRQQEAYQQTPNPRHKTTSSSTFQTQPFSPAVTNDSAPSLPWTPPPPSTPIQQVIIQAPATLPTSLITHLLTALESHRSLLSEARSVTQEAQARDGALQWVGRAIRGLATSDGLKERIVRWVEAQGAGQKEVREVKRQLRMYTGYRLGDMLTKEGIRSEIERAGRRGLGNLEYRIGGDELAGNVKEGNGEGEAATGVRGGKEAKGLEKGVCPMCGGNVRKMDELATPVKIIPDLLEGKVSLGKREPKSQVEGSVPGLAENLICTTPIIVQQDPRQPIGAEPPTTGATPLAGDTSSNFVESPKVIAHVSELGAKTVMIEEKDDLMQAALDAPHEKVDWDEWAPACPELEIINEFDFDKMIPSGRSLGLETSGLDNQMLDKILNRQPQTVIEEPETVHQENLRPRLVEQVEFNEIQEAPPIAGNDVGLLPLQPESREPILAESHPTRVVSETHSLQSCEMLDEKISTLSHVATNTNSKILPERLLPTRSEELDRCSMIAQGPYQEIQGIVPKRGEAIISCCSSSASSCGTTEQMDSMNPPSAKKPEWKIETKQQVTATELAQPNQDRVLDSPDKQETAKANMINSVSSEKLTNTPRSLSRHDAFTLTSHRPREKDGHFMQLSVSVSSDSRSISREHLKPEEPDPAQQVIPLGAMEELDLEDLLQVGGTSSTPKPK